MGQVTSEVVGQVTSEHVGGVTSKHIDQVTNDSNDQVTDENILTKVELNLNLQNNNEERLLYVASLPIFQYP